MPHASVDQGPITVAIFEQRAETLQYVLALTAQSQRLSVDILKDAASYFEVYGASSGPDILLVGLDTDAREALNTVRQILALAPTCGVIVYGKEGTMELLSQAMEAGARRYLPYPCDGPEMLAAIDAVYEKMKPLAETRLALPASDTARESTGPRHAPKVVAVFSPKGGVGTSTLAVNLACALQSTGRRVVVVDGNISFGNVGVFFNLSPSKSMLQLVGDAAGITEAGVESVLLPHSSGIKVMLAPLKPEEGDSVHSAHLRAIIAILRASYDYVVVDTWPSYDERVLAVLETADQILIPTAPELPSIKNLASFLRVAQLLGYPNEKLIPVLMRANSVAPGYLKDIEAFLKQPLVWRIVSDGQRVTQSVNNGEPFVLADPGAPVSQNIVALARMLDGRDEAMRIAPERARPFWKRPLLGLGRAG